MHQRASPRTLDQFAAFCRQWLAGADARLSRAAAQTLRLFADVEAAGFGRRMPELLPLLLAAIENHAVVVSP